MTAQLPVKNPYKEFTYVIPCSDNGNKTVRINYDTTYFRVLALTLNTLAVNFGGQGDTTTLIGAGIGIKLSAPTPFVELTNTGAADLTVTVALGHVGDVVDSRFVVSNTVNVSNIAGTTLTDIDDVIVLTTATTKVKSSNAATKTVLISNLAANATKIRVGTSSAGAARGAEVPIGGTISMDYSGDVYVYNPSASTINIGVLEIRT
ncbi:MAG: hypothetical protein ACREGF_01455 [Candidatus Saccharimonadales bacterium]